MIWLFILAGTEIVRDIDLAQFDVFQVRDQYLMDVSDNQIGFFDLENTRVLVFDFEGTLLYSFGSKGLGPGEMRRPEGLARLGSDWILAERSVNMIHRFDPKGNFLESKETTDFYRFPQFGPRGDVVFIKGDFSGWEPVLMHAKLGLPSQSIYESKMERPKVTMPWSCQLLWRVGSDVVAICETSGPLVKVYNLKDGTLAWEVVANLARAPLEDETFTFHKRVLLQRAAGKMSSGLLQSIDRDRPDAWPFIGQLLCDEQDRVWVFQAPCNEEKLVQYQVFEAGREVGRGEVLGRPHVAYDEHLFGIFNAGEGGDPKLRIWSVQN